MSHRQKILSLSTEAHEILEAQPAMTQSKFADEAILQKGTVDDLFKGDFANVMQNLRVLRSNYPKGVSVMDVVKAERILRGEQ